MKTLGVVALATVGLVGFAHAADILPTTKPPPAPKNCFASVWAHLDSTPADCPRSYGPFTLYATLDAGLMCNTNGAPWNPAFANGTQGLISKQSNGPKWLWSPNNINQSVIGVTMSQRSRTAGRSSARSSRGSTPCRGLPLQLAARASDEQRQAAFAPERDWGLEPRGSMGQFAVLPRGQQQDDGTLTGGRVNALSLDGLIA